MCFPHRTWVPEMRPGSCVDVQPGAGMEGEGENGGDGGSLTVLPSPSSHTSSSHGQHRPRSAHQHLTPTGGEILQPPCFWLQMWKLRPREVKTSNS